MKFTKEQLEAIIRKYMLEGKEAPRWVYNELKYLGVTLRDRIPGVENKNYAEINKIEIDYHGCVKG